METYQFIIILVLSIFPNLTSKNKDLLIESSINNLNQISKQHMEQVPPSNCLILDTLEFKGKQPLMDYLNRCRIDIENARFESQRSAPIDVVYDENSLHNIFSLVDFSLYKNDFKTVSDEEFRSKVKEIYNLEILNPKTKLEKYC